MQKISAALSQEVSVSIRLNNESFYQEDASAQSYTFPPGPDSRSRIRRYFTWPIISSQIDFVFTGLVEDVELEFRIFGGTIEQCRLQTELSGRNWWKLIKVDTRSAQISEIVSSYGVVNDYDPQSREVSLDGVSFAFGGGLQYKNKLVDEWDTLKVKRVELNVYTESVKMYSAVYNGQDSSKTSWISNYLYSTVNLINREITSWEEVDRIFRSSVVEIQATTLGSITESKFKRVSGKFHVSDMNCLIDGVRAEDTCASRCIQSACVAFFIDVQGCCILSSFNETHFSGVLTPDEVAQGYRELFRIYQYDTLRLNVWPEGALFARDMERGFQCRVQKPDEHGLNQEFNCDKGSIASSVVQCSERGTNGQRIRIMYGNYGRTESNSDCFPSGAADVDCISPRVARFIESSCTGKHRCRIDLPLLADNYLAETCTDKENLYLDIQYECYQIRSDEEIRITSIESIRDTPLRELYSDILHFVADPEGETGLEEKQSKVETDCGSSNEIICPEDSSRGILWPKSKCSLVDRPCPYDSVGKAYRLCTKVNWEPADLSRCISKSNPAAIIGSNAASPNFTASELAELQANFLEPNHTIFGGDISSSILMMDTLMKLQAAELKESNENATQIAEKSIIFTNNLGNAVSNLLDEEHRSAWEDMPKEEWASKANDAILLLEEAGFLMAQKALAESNSTSGIVEVHQTFENSALQVASVLPAGADLPDEVMFPNQTIPVLPRSHWATQSGEIWVPVDHDEKQTSQLVFAVYSNLDILFGNEVESDFVTINIDEEHHEQELDINEQLTFDEFDENFQESNQTTNQTVTQTCLKLENGTERCTSDDDTKPHLTLNSHIISATLRPPNDDFFHIRSVNITMKHKKQATIDGSGRCVFWNVDDLKWSGQGCQTIKSNRTHTQCTVSISISNFNVTAFSN